MEQNGVLYSACLVSGYFPCHAYFPVGVFNEFKYSMKYLVNKYNW